MTQSPITTLPMRSHYSHSCWTRLSVALVLLVTMMAWTSQAGAVAYSSSQAGTWQDINTWGGAGVPVSPNDSITVNNHIVEVTDIRSFGDSVGPTTSFTAATGSTFYLNGAGTQLSHVAGSTLIKNSTFDSRVTGTGTFVNNGRHEVEAGSGSIGLLIYNGSPTYQNNNEFVFTETNSRLMLGWNALDTPVFNNAGTIEVAVPTTGFAAIQSGQPVSTLGQYTASNPITFTSGALVFSPPNVTSITDANYPSLFGAIGASSELRLAGELQNINLTAAGIGAANLARTTLGHDSIFGRQLVAHPAGTTIDVPVADGGILFNSILAATSATINIPTGRTVTNAAGSLITGGRNTRITGNGTFQNDGEFNTTAQSGTVGMLLYTGNPTFINDGTYRLTENDSRLQLSWGAADDAQFQNNGTFEVALGSNTNVGYINSGGLATDGNFTATNPITLTQGILVFGPQGHDTYDDAAIASLFGPRGANTEVRLVGTLKDINFTAATDLSRIRLGHGTGLDGVTAHADGLTIDVPDSAGGLTMGGVLSAPAQTLTIPTGRTATNVAGSLMNIGKNSRIIGDGTFQNNGKVKLTAQSGTFGLLMYSNSPTFINAGELEFAENTAELSLGHGAGTPIFNNLAGAVVRADMPLGTHVADVNTDNALGIFNNAGAVEVLSGTLRFASNLSVPAVTSGGTSLDAGEWRVLHSGNNAILDLLSGGTSPGSITNIGSGAKVVLGGATPQFNQLSSTTLNVDGTFGVQDQQVYNLSTGLNMGSGGILEFGLEGIDEGGTLTTGIDVDGNVTFDGSQIDIFDLGGLGAGTYRIMEFVSASDLATLGDVPSNFNFGLIQRADFLELSVVELPEPSSLTCLLLAGLGMPWLARRRRRGKTAK